MDETNRITGKDIGMARASLTRISNELARFLVGTLGLNLQGAEVLVLRGRKTGKSRSLVVNTPTARPRSMTSAEPSLRNAM